MHLRLLPGQELDADGLLEKDSALTQEMMLGGGVSEWDKIIWAQAELVDTLSSKGCAESLHSFKEQQAMPFVPQRDKLKKWVHWNLIRVNKTKCKVLHLNWDNCYQYSLGNEQVKSSPAKDLWELVDEMLDLAMCNHSPGSQFILGCSKSSVGSK
ncbi:hypothetical protein WISP_87182 [Willisornis vidua]|uniref:Uncharacterized protein n=1 Tax=Willisornis vidua TaxID=1566151 RepID=A0ABQ9D3V1_9PASS|nr:hypothetical protein WISP_87182 [Willisornis vidua]